MSGYFMKMISDHTLCRCLGDQKPIYEGEITIQHLDSHCDRQISGSLSVYRLVAIFAQK
jgi:hypothetical protein